MSGLESEGGTKSVNAAVKAKDKDINFGLEGLRGQGLASSTIHRCFRGRVAWGLLSGRHWRDRLQWVRLHMYSQSAMHQTGVCVCAWMSGDAAAAAVSKHLRASLFIADIDSEQVPRLQWVTLNVRLNHLRGQFYWQFTLLICSTPRRNLCIHWPTVCTVM